MPVDSFTIINHSKASNTLWHEVLLWFAQQGFTQTQFNKRGIFRTIPNRNGKIVFKIKQREGYLTFHKFSRWGALLVFELTLSDDKLVYSCYAPIFWFALFTTKLNFQKKAIWLFNYLEEGYKINEQFQAHFNDASSHTLQSNADFV